MKNKLAIAGIIIMTGAFFILLWMVEGTAASYIDEPVREFFYGIRSEFLTPLMKLFTYIGNWETITALCVILLIMKKPRMTYGVPLALGTISVTVMSNIIKSLVKRPRPDSSFFLIEQDGWSFTSGHAFTSLFVFGLLIYLIRKNMQAGYKRNLLISLLAFPALLVGMSRIYLGVHYPTDVLAGWCLAAAALFTEAIIIDKRS